MEYVNFGSAGVKVSPIALGLGFRGQGSAEEAQRVIEHAIDSGINLIDCANVYGLGDDLRVRGSSEQVLARVLKTKRNDVVLTSKVHSEMGDGPNDRGSSRYHIMRQVENSLVRLGTDHIDVYLLHGYDTETPLEETLRALDDLVSQGKVLYVGCCNFEAWQVCKALWTQDLLNADGLICVQNPYNLLKRDLEGEMFSLLGDQGLGAMAYSPLAVGLLSGGYAPGAPPPPNSPWGGGKREGALASVLSPRVMAVVDAVRDVARERGKTMVEVAMNWVLSHPEITVAISGSDTINQIDDNLGALGWQLSAEEIETLDQVSSGLELAEEL
jgi:aryl-alcohol dehydrogenase-like predicted oxidoreductase